MAPNFNSIFAMEAPPPRAGMGILHEPACGPVRLTPQGPLSRLAPILTTQQEREPHWPQETSSTKKTGSSPSSPSTRPHRMNALTMAGWTYEMAEIWEDFQK